MTTEVERLYAKRDLFALGNDYIKHTMHMTSESLHSKSDIAAEFAVRDIQISQQAAEIEKLRTEWLDAEARGSEYRTEIERLKDGYMNGYEGGKQEARDVAHEEIDKANALLRQALEALAKYTTLGVLGGRVPIDAELVAAIKQHLGDV